VTSASKGWNLAGAKCALIFAGNDSTAALLASLPEEVACRTGILGLHANIAAYSCTGWLDHAVAHIVANDVLLREHLPTVT